MEADDYFVAGVLMAMSLVHGGAAPRFLAQELFTALVSGPDHVTVSLLSLPESSMKKDLQAVRIFAFCSHYR